MANEGGIVISLAETWQDLVGQQRNPEQPMGVWILSESGAAQKASKTAFPNVREVLSVR